MKIKLIWHLLLFVILAGCLDPYPTDDIGGDVDALVVDGFINTTHQSASVKLTKAMPLDTTSTPEVIDYAEVSIESEAGSSFAVPGIGNGQYQATSMNIDVEARHRLSIKLRTGQQYFSDYVALSHTPDIDSVTFGEGKDGINIYVNTHDPTGISQYYKWDYVETWKYVASFFSTYEFANGVAYERIPENRIYECWSTMPSSRIIIGNTIRLSEDIVSNFLVASPTSGSVQLSKKYSINVLQRSLSKEEYDYWTSLQKTTESIGGLFDALPYPVTGNIHAANGNGLALGYFGGGEVKEKRLFVSVYELPLSVGSKTMRVPCTQDDVSETDVAGLVNLSPSSSVIIDPIYQPFVGIVGYTYSYPNCVDCRTYGGTTVMPDFWIE